VNETVDAAQVNERTKVHDGGHNTLADLALFRLVEEAGAVFALALLEKCTTGQHNVVAVLVELKNHRLDFLAQVGGQVANATQFDQGGGQEAAQTDVNDQPPLTTSMTWPVTTPSASRSSRHHPTHAHTGRASWRESGDLLCLLFEERELRRIADGDNLAGVNIVLDGEFAGGNNTLGFVADVEENFVPVDFDNGSFDEVTVVEEFESFLDLGQEIIGAADVVDSDLLRTGGRWGVS
jgi:hypothetical protein